ncbi:MAG: DNA repair protein RadA [Candidatus Parcubacteria bacterium]|nr:DNA repair protein RadA [Candidatus Parcubacteria bacterium]
MPKQPQTIFACSKCGAQYPKWTGRCSTCGAWGTVAEEQSIIPNSQFPIPKIDKSQLIDFKTSETPKFERLQTKIGEFDRVLGGGIVAGSLILLGGEPGIGKSTLVLQICHQLQSPILYVSGEESASQIKMRIDRLNLDFSKLKFLAENNAEKVAAFAIEEKPSLIIIDSIQTLYSSELPSEAGSINQVRICTVKLLEIAKKYNIAILIIGHVTKDGQVAGPKSLEHLVDAVMYLESSTSDDFRLLRCAKNRFGSTQEIGIFSMSASGLLEVKNPSELFLPQNQEPISGSALTCVMEGSRPFLIEVQALVTKTMFGYPQRRSSGFDLNRIQMLAAVLIKRANVPLLNQDIHLNVTGGLKINETGADLAVCLAIVSSLKNKAIEPQTLILGEVGLGGEIRPVYQLDKRIEEALKLNFKKIIIPIAKTAPKQKELVAVKNLEQAIKEIL